jgi:hypothetical protein
LKDEVIDVLEHLGVVPVVCLEAATGEELKERFFGVGWEDVAVLLQAATGEELKVTYSLIDQLI